MTFDQMVDCYNWYWSEVTQYWLNVNEDYWTIFGPKDTEFFYVGK